MKRRICVLATIVCTMVLSIAGCKKEAKLPEVNLSVWCDEQNVAMTNQIIEEFKNAYAKEAVFNITVSEESELTCKETVLSNPEMAADVFTFPDDQFAELYRGGALLEITENKGKIIEDCGGAESGAILAASRDGKLYAYPKTAGNGYFLYYNKKYFKEADLKNFNSMLEIAKKQDKKVSMDFSSGWYLFSFFKGAGLDVGANEDGRTNHCNWNSTTGKYKGVDVAKALLAIATHEGFRNCGDDQFVDGIKDESIIAGVNGPWNASKLQEYLGENYGACMLPKYNLAGDSAQMCSFTGYKLVGVNAHSKEAHWAMMLANWITNEENQKKSFDTTGECPANINVAKMPEILASPAVAALAEQSRFGYTQSIAETFWNPTYIFGTIIGNGNSDHVELQELLDTLVTEIEKPAQ